MILAVNHLQLLNGNSKPELDTKKIGFSTFNIL